MSDHHLRLAYFSRSVVVAVAERRGIFGAHGLEVEAVPVTSSPHQFAMLRAGECDLALTSPDNVAAYGLGDRNPLGARLDVRILLGLDAGLGLSVMAAPSVTDLRQLRGGVVGVDVPQSGFALALFGVLEAAGLVAGRDFTVAELGATPRRRAALAGGACDATLLNAGHDIAAEMDGCRRLAAVTDRYHPYLGAVLAATGPWLAAHQEDGRRFVAAWREAVGRVLDPRHDAEVIAAAGETLGVPDAAAARFVAVLRSERDGLVPDGRVDPAALATVLALRGVDPAGGELLVDRRLVAA